MLEKLYEEADSEAAGSYPDEFLAKTEYESNSEDILKGFRVFQKRHVYGSLALQLFLAAMAAASQILAIVSDKSGDIAMNVMILTMCVLIGIWLFMRPINTRKNLAKAIENLKGTVYEAEICTDKIKISTIYDAPVENAGQTEETEQEAPENNVPAEEDEEEGEGIPATVIHLDNIGVEITETDDLYVVYVKKINIFVIPKKGISQEDKENIREKLEPLMGARYICRARLD